MPETSVPPPTAAAAPPPEAGARVAPGGLAHRGALFALAWWAMALVWIALALAAGAHNPLAIAVSGVLMITLYAAFCLSAEYLCRLFPLRPTRLLATTVHQLSAGIALAFIWTLVARGLHYLLATVWQTQWATPLLDQPALLFVAGTLLYLMAAAGFYTAQAYGRATAAQRQADQALLLAREAELRALRSQINPHFLFNSLHSISALTAIDPVRARQMCIHLAELFRLTLRTGEQELVPLADELAVLRAYLAVEQVRFGARLRLHEDLAPEALPCPVPALLLQPLVENAVKHGIAGLTRPGCIHIAARRQDAALRLEIRNDYDPESVSPERNGIGLENVRRRLATHYGQLGRLDWRGDGAEFHVMLEIPCAAA